MSFGQRPLLGLRQSAEPEEVHGSWCDVSFSPGRDGVNELDGRGGVVAGAVLAGLLDAVGVVPGALDDGG